jgi:hypothetical protein
MSPRRLLGVAVLVAFVIGLVAHRAGAGSGTNPLDMPTATPQIDMPRIKLRTMVELAPPKRRKIARRLDAYAGAGAWVDQYDPSIVDNPWPALVEMKRAGVRTLYLETGSWRLPRERDFRDREGVELTIQEAHSLGMKVIGWYLPGLDDMKVDMRRTRAAVKLRTKDKGERFDGFAIDIESTRVHPISRRNKVLMRYSAKVRRLVGRHYALGAVVPDQRSSTQSPGLWPGFPYRATARFYDVFLPMAYSSYRGHGAGYVYAYSRSNAAFARAATGKPVHLIGGIDRDLRPGEHMAVVRGALAGGAVGASFYDFATAQPGTLRALRAVPR